ncbi:MAG: hypothetical protein JSS27_12895 [Planctomycetes bacterium]|nr:hypothetical protein [Planctomycetota bacterium]
MLRSAITAADQHGIKREPNVRSFDDYDQALSDDERRDLFGDDDGLPWELRPVPGDWG